MLAWFGIWNLQLQHSIAALETVIIESIANTISATLLAGFRATGALIVRLILREYMWVIYKYLTCGKIPIIQSTLKLLVAMVNYSNSTTKELQESFNFSLKSLTSFLNIRKKSLKSGKMIQDFSTLFIKFFMGFVIRGVWETKKKLLEANIVPDALTKSTISRCLQQKSRDDSFATIKLLTNSF